MVTRCYKTICSYSCCHDNLLFQILYRQVTYNIISTFVYAVKSTYCNCLVMNLTSFFLLKYKYPPSLIRLINIHKMANEYIMYISCNFVHYRALGIIPSSSLAMKTYSLTPKSCWYLNYEPSYRAKRVLSSRNGGHFEFLL